jgi:hypothetical protein
MVASARRLRAVELGLRAGDSLGRPLQRLTRAVDRGLGAVEQVRRLAERASAIVQPRLPLRQRGFSGVLQAFALVGGVVSLVGDSVPLVGDDVALVGDVIALIRDRFPALELDRPVAQ